MALGNGLELSGIHHVSAITGNVVANRDFYTRALGLRLVKKTVNQDATDVYHLFYADGEGAAGTDVTFFDFLNAAPNRPGSGEIQEIALRVPSAEAMEYWQERFQRLGIDHGPIEDRAGHRVLPFTDTEGQRLALMDDGDAKIPGGTPWDKAPVPEQYGIRGLGSVSISSGRPEATLRLLTELMGFRIVDDQPARANPDHRTITLETGLGGPNGLFFVHARPGEPQARLGRGGVHHVAFRVPTFEAHEAWQQHLQESGVQVTPVIDRFYFRSIYFREPGGVLYELATDGPGFATDEPMESLGESLALPPFLKPQRSKIEATLRPLDTRQAVTTTEYGQPVPSEEVHA